MTTAASTKPPISAVQRAGLMRTRATPIANVASQARVRFASTQASSGSIAQAIDAAVKPSRTTKSATLSAPSPRPSRSPVSSAAAIATAASASRPISTVVSGPSCRPPWPTRPAAASRAANPTVARALGPTRGRAMRRASPRESTGTACEDTVPGRGAGAGEHAGGERGEKHDEGRGQRPAAVRQRAHGARLEQLAADAHRRGAGAGGVLDALLLVRSGRVEGGAAAVAARAAPGVGAGRAARRRAAAPRGAGAAAGAGAGARTAASAAAGAAPRVERGQAGAVDDVAAGGVLVAVGGQLGERPAVRGLRVRAVDALVAT